MIHVGDHVCLKAGGEPMLVVAVRTGCDGTGGDGVGLYCEWWEERPAADRAREIAFPLKRVQSWISESAVVVVEPAP